MVYEVHEVVELRSDDDFGTAVALTAILGVVGHEVVVFTTTGSSESLGRYAEFVLEHLHDGGSAQSGEVPVVADVCA